MNATPPRHAAANANSAAPQLTFPSECRLKKPAEFTRVYERKERAGDQHLLVFGAANDLPYSRIGLSVSRKQGNAVRRNRLKRLLREAFRLTRPGLPTGFDWILIPRVGTDGGLEDFRRSLKYLLKKLAKRSSSAAKPVLNSPAPPDGTS